MHSQVQISAKNCCECQQQQQQHPTHSEGPCPVLVADDHLRNEAGSSPEHQSAPTAQSQTHTCLPTHATLDHVRTTFDTFCLLPLPLLRPLLLCPVKSSRATTPTTTQHHTGSHRASAAVIPFAQQEGQPHHLGTLGRVGCAPLCHICAACLELADSHRVNTTREAGTAGSCAGRTHARARAGGREGAVGDRGRRRTHCVTRAAAETHTQSAGLRQQGGKGGRVTVLRSLRC